MIIKSINGTEVLDTWTSLIKVFPTKPKGNRFRFRPLPKNYPCPIRNIRVPVYELIETKPGQEQDRIDIEAYFCNYQSNDVKKVEIGSEYPYFFTATLTGCSIGISKIAGSSTLVVAHANDSDAGAEIFAAAGSVESMLASKRDQLLGGAPVTSTTSRDGSGLGDRMRGMLARKFQKSKQRKALTSHGFTSSQIYDPEHLGRPIDEFDDICTTLMGFRHGTTWTFVRQTYNNRLIEFD